MFSVLYISEQCYEMKFDADGLRVMAHQVRHQGSIM